MAAKHICLIALLATGLFLQCSQLSIISKRKLRNVYETLILNIAINKIMTSLTLLVIVISNMLSNSDKGIYGMGNGVAEVVWLMACFLFSHMLCISLDRLLAVKMPFA